MGRADRGPFPAARGSDLPWITTEQMREIDRIVVEELGVTLVQMMENAGRHLADLAIRRFACRSAVVLAGPGANGGGGIAAARHLANRGVDVRVVLSRGAEALGEVPRLQLEAVQRLGVGVSEALEAPGVPAADLVVDAVIGYGLSGDPRGRAAELVTWAKDQEAPVLSLDVPSGLDATTGRVGDPCVRAAATLTLAMPKVGLRAALDVVGELYLADVSVPPRAYRAVGVEVGPIFWPGAILRVLLP